MFSLGNHNANLMQPKFAGVLAEETVKVAGGDGTRWALDFDGTNDFLNCGDINELDLASEFTYIITVKPDDITSRGGVWQKSKNSQNKISMVNWDDSKTYAEVASGARNEYGTFVTNTVLANGRYNTLATVFYGPGATDADRLKCYADCVQIVLDFTGRTIPATTPQMDASDAGWGNYSNAEYFNGTLLNGIIYSRALTLDEITKLWEGTVAPLDIPDLVSSWPMGEGFGNSTVIRDENNQAYNGLMTNFPANPWINVGINP